jgi:hypothetical protein
MQRVKKQTIKSLKSPHNAKNSKRGAKKLSNSMSKLKNNNSGSKLNASVNENSVFSKERKTEFLKNVDADIGAMLFSSSSDSEPATIIGLEEDSVIKIVSNFNPPSDEKSKSGSKQPVNSHSMFTNQTHTHLSQNEIAVLGEKITQESQFQVGSSNQHLNLF